MNSPGQKFADDFAADELRALAPIFLRGAHVIYAHAALQRAGGKGLLSGWAQRQFPGPAERNAFFERVGRALAPERAAALAALPADVTPDGLWARLRS